MISIVKAGLQDVPLLTELGRQTFIESHGHSGPAADIENYVKEKFSDSRMKEELEDQANIYHIIYHDGRPAGYSKIILDASHSNISLEHVTRLERLYLLKAFYSLKLGYDLLAFNIDLSKRSGQQGIWLFTWKENHRAIAFYEKNRFRIIGSHDFMISATHSNPNHQMLLEY